MFSKAKRFEPIAPVKTQTKALPKQDVDKHFRKTISTAKSKIPFVTPSKQNLETLSQCSSIRSTKSFVTPKPIKPSVKSTSSVKSSTLPKANTKIETKPISNAKLQEDLIKAHEAEIRNKDYTIIEHNKQIDELKNEIANLHKILKEVSKGDINVEKLSKQLNELTLLNDGQLDYKNISNDLSVQIEKLEKQIQYLEQEVNHKQVELTSLEEVIIIRDSLCSDLQKKLTDMESCLEETKQRLEMVKGHHALALEANESIRREYKLELETLKAKMEEEKQNIISKCKLEQESTKVKYNEAIKAIKLELLKEKDDKIYDLEQQIVEKDQEMKAKLDQIDEATHEKLRLCEIQFEERSRSIQEHWEQQQKEVQDLKSEANELKYKLNITEDRYNTLLKEVTKLKDENEILRNEKLKISQELDDLKEENKKKHIDYENEINKLTADIDKAIKEKNKFEMSLSVTRDIVQVLTMRLRESDNELEHLENQIQTLTDTKEVLEEELATYKNSLSNTLLECNEYKEALVNILKSKAALAKEHNRIMEHNVSLIESLQNVEKEAYRELGTIKCELIEDVELLKKESNSQIKMLQDEVEKKRMLCELATEHAGQAAAAAEQSRALLSHAASELARLEAENLRLQQQIQDQQSLVVELSLLRQENEELTMKVAKQSSLMDKMKKDAELIQAKPKSPSVLRKTHKIGKENVQTIISPLRERNH